MVAAMSSNAQTLGDYTFTTGTDASKWIPLTSYTSLSISGDGAASQVLNLGFTFPFGEDSYTQFSVNTDGTLRLGGTATGTGSYTTPFSSTNANTNSPKINFLGWDGYLVSGTHHIYYSQFGDSLMVVEMCIGTYTTASRNYMYSCQYHLYSNGKIEIVFPNETFTTSSVSHQMGICVNASDGWIVDNTNTATHFTNGSSLTWTGAQWPEPNTYYTFAPPVISCPKPAAINVTNLSSISATFEIVPNGNETLWQANINPPVMGISSITLPTSTGTLPILNPMTTYTVGVRAICGEGDTSDYREITFTTPCPNVALPYSENFDEITTSTTAATGETPLCWYLAHQDVPMSGSYLPQVYYTSPTATTRNCYSGDYSLRMYYRCIYAMPGVNNVQNTILTFRHKQTSSGYPLVVGVMSNLLDESTFVPVDTIINDNTTDFFLHEIYFTNYTGNGHYIAFRNLSTSNYSYSYNYIDDVELTAVPNCLKPEMPLASMITSNTANVAWGVRDSNQANFELAYGTSTDVDSMTTINVNAAFTTLNGLNSNTTYYMYVRALCSADETSEWSNMGTFRTLCDATALPYVENFDNWTTSTTSTTHVMPDCWTLTSFDVAQDASSQPQIYYNNPTSTTQNCRTSPYSLRLYYRGITALPVINTDVQNTVLKFWVKQTASSYLMVVGVLSDVNDPSTFVAIDTIRNTNTTDFQQHEVFFNNYTGNGRHIAFRNISTANYSYSYNYIDDIELTLLPSCVKTETPYVASVSSSSATISWNTRDSAQNNFLVAYGTDMDSLITTGATSTTKYIYGLSDNTTYYLKVRAICGEGDSSEWSDVLTFKTPCNIASTAIFSEDFESLSGDEIPDCWTMGWFYQATGTGVKTQPYKTATAYKHSGSRAMTLQDQANGTSSWMSTQKLPIDRAGKYAVSVWVYRQTASTHPLEGIKLWLSPNADDTTGATFLGEVHRHYGAAPAEAAAGWYNYQFPIEGNGNKYILIQGTSTYGNATYFDDLEVYEFPCEKPADYTENFEHQDNNMVPLCWDNSASTSTTMNSNPHYIWGTYTYNGNKMMRMYNYFVQSGVATTNSPAIVLDSLNRELVFDYSHHASSGAVYIRISNDGGNTFTDVDTLYHDGNGSSYSDPGIWSSRSIDLSNYAGDTIILQFYTMANYGNGSVFIDNLQVREVNNCPIPTDVTAAILTASSAEVSWNGDAAEYVVAYGTGSNPELMDTVHAFSTTAVISGLNAETTYNFFVQSVCGDNTSYWSLPASAYTGYCQPAPTSVDGQGIVRLQFGNGDQVVDNTTRPTSAPYYGNYASMVGSVAAGTIADVTITYQTGYTYGTIIWVDWDNSLTFDANEVVYVGEASNSNPTTLTASFPISANTATGMYRMRIAGSDDYYDDYTTSIAAAAGANPCPNSSYTIVHDYTLNVTAAASCAPVTNVVANNITNSTATISWSLLDTTQSNFAVAYGTVNDIDSMTVVNVTTPNVTLTGLTDATTYYVSVKAVCGATDHSPWSSIISFTTELCDAANQCALTVEMTDSYGDGWNGGRLNIVDAATNITIASLTINNGSYQTANVNVCDGRTYNIVWSGGMYVDEVSFDIYNSFGALVLSVERPMDGTLLAYTANCTQTLPDSVTVSASAMPAALGSVTGAGTYAYGETVTLTAMAMPLAHFTQWSNGDTNSTITYVATEDTAFVAYFAYNPVTVTLVNANPTMGTTSPAPGTYTYQVGDTVNAMATAFDGYQFSNWNISMGLGSGTDTTNPVMLVVPTILAGQNINVTANFEAAIVNYTVTTHTNNLLMGTVLGGGIYNEGDTATLTAMPATNCHFVVWNDGDTNAVRTFVVTSDTTFTATFAFNPVTVTLSYNDTVMGYTVPAAGTYTFQVGDVMNAMAYANTGYHFVNYTVSAMGMNDTSSFNPIAQVVPAALAGQHIYVVANFAANQYNLTVESANEAMGTVTGSGVFDYNTTATIAAVPAQNYHFVMWNDGDSNAVRNVLVLGDATYTAYFAINPVTVNLTVNDATMGTTTPAPGTYTYQPGTTVEAEAVANDGFRFIGWTVNVMGQTIEYTENPVSVTIPEMAAGMTIDVTANFEAIPTYEVTLTATCNIDGDNHSSHQLIGAGRYAEGENVTILIEETDDNTRFTGWYVNGELVSTNSLYSFVMEAADITFEARFEHMVIGIDDVNAESINIYSRNNQIVVRGAENQNVRIFDAVGRLVAQRQANGEEETFAVQHTGVYLVQVGRQAARRVVIR